MSDTAERMPAPIQVFRQELNGMESQFSAVLPKHIPAERFARVIMTAVSQNPDLLKCTRRSLWNAAMKAAQDGLLADNREGAIVAYKDQAQWMPMIAGLRKKVRNSNEIATWECHVVYENDEFDFALGDDPHITHKPAMADAGKPIAAYSIATLKSGERSREVMTIAEIEAVRSRSRAARNGPWVTDWSEMARKTVARRHSKVLPMSSDLDDLMRRDEDLYDFDAAKKETASSEQPRTLSGRLDRLALAVDRHDPGTGEIIETQGSDDAGTAGKDPEPSSLPAKISNIEHTGAPGAEGRTESDLLAKDDQALSEAAKRGSRALDEAIAKIPDSRREALEMAMARRHRHAAKEADAAKTQAAVKDGER